MKFCDTIKMLRTNKNISQSEIAKHLSISRQAYSLYENGKREPGIETIKLLSDYFDVPIGHLLGHESNLKPLNAPLRGGKMISVLGSVPAGIAVEAVEDIIDEIEIDARLENTGFEYFGLMVTGESMYPEYKDGDIVVVRKQETADNGDDVVAYVDGYNATIKRILISDKGITLRALNPAYETKTYSKEEVQELPVTILGVVVEQRRRRK